MIPLIIVFLLMLLLKNSALLPFANSEQSTSLALGFILVFAYLVGNQIKRLSLPQITGFIIAGILCGPYILGFVSESDVKDLQLLDGLALSLIALTAGGEMKIVRLRRQLKDLQWRWQSNLRSGSYSGGMPAGGIDGGYSTVPESGKLVGARRAKYVVEFPFYDMDLGQGLVSLSERSRV